MADIINYDVRTYVQELMKKEFSSKNNDSAFKGDKRYGQTR